MQDGKLAAAAFPALAKFATNLDRKRGWILPLSPTFDVLGGAVYWLDEVVLTDLEMLSTLRPVLRYRTMLAMREPGADNEAQWNAGQILFPNWIGFHPKRRRWTPRFAAAYRRMELEAQRLIYIIDAADREDEAGALSVVDTGVVSFIDAGDS